MKKLLSLLLSFLMVLALSACGTEYEDTNGADNFELQTITDEDIIHLKTGASGLSYSESSIGGITSSEYSSKNFNGVEQLYQSNYILDSDVVVNISYINVTAGNFRMVVINNDEIISDIRLDSFGEIYTFEDVNGAFSIHVS